MILETLTPLDLNEAERVVSQNDRGRTKYIYVNADLFRRLVNLARGFDRADDAEIDRLTDELAVANGDLCNLRTCLGEAEATIEELRRK